MDEYIESEKDKRIKNQRYEIQCLKNSLKKLRQHIKHLESKNRVVRGEWIDTPDKTSAICSNCKADWNVFDNDTYRFNYCPNCGADMRATINYKTGG